MILTPPNNPPVLSLAQALRQKCLDCLGATSARSAFDCISELCPVYPRHPFRGKPKPNTLQPAEGTPHWETEQAERVHRERPRQRPSKALVRAMCQRSASRRIARTAAALLALCIPGAHGSRAVNRSGM